MEITGGIIWNGINLLYLLHGAEVAMKSQPGVHMHIPSHSVHMCLPRACAHNPVHTDTHRQTITAGTTVRSVTLWVKQPDSGSLNTEATAHLWRGSPKRDLLAP